MPARIYRNISELVTLSGANKKKGRRPEEKDLAIIKKATVLVDNGKILWRGKDSQFPMARFKSELGSPKKWKEVDIKNQVMMPGFVECHTHTIFGGNRADEFELRNTGVSYQEIARRGGGIISTVKQTRKLNASELLKKAQKDVNDFARQGVTTLEVKSGYGLDLKNELKILRVCRCLKGPRVISTFLGAHGIPPEFKSAESYIDFMIQKVLPQIVKEKLADRIDVFIEKGYFSPELAQRYLQAGLESGLGVTAHTEQLSRSGGFQVGLSLGAQSLDHLVCLQSSDVETLAGSETVSVLLPAADFYLKMNYPPARQLIDLGARVALSTDYNPGSSPTRDLGFVGLLARLEMGMKLSEVIVAYTLNAASALGLGGYCGSIDPGKSADFCVLNDHVDRLFYSQGYHPVVGVWTRGRKITKKGFDF